MQIPHDAVLLRIFIGELDKHHHTPLYEAILLRAREMGLAGATVLRGPMGFGAHSRVHTAKILRLSEDLPVIIEIVDKEDKINAFLPELDKMIGDGMLEVRPIEEFETSLKVLLRLARRQHQRLVARIEQAADGHAQRLHAAGGDDDLAGGIQVHAVQLSCARSRYSNTRFR